MKSREYLHVFNTKFNNILLQFLQQITIDTQIINDMFPQRAQIDNDDHSRTIRGMIDEILPPEIRRGASDYFENIIIPRVTG